MIAYGKWILSGEHSVLRGGQSLAFPLLSRAMQTTWQKGTGHGPTLQVHGESAKEIEFLFWSVLEKACSLVKIPREKINLAITIENQIPLGTGLGSSAALCVSVARLLAPFSEALQDIAHQEKMAHELEHLFHGESSGLDVAVSIRGRALRFQRGLTPMELPILKVKFPMTLSWTGARGATKECVEMVQRLIRENPTQGAQLDQQMQQSVAHCEAALFAADLAESERVKKLCAGMDLGLDCFQQWGLIDDSLRAHLAQLRDLGALASKPTGSGRGGYVLALWPEQPPPKGPFEFLSCF